MGEADYQKAGRDLALLLKAWIDRGPDAVDEAWPSDIDERKVLLRSLALNVFYMKKTTNPEAVYDVLLHDDPLHQAQVVVSETARARRFLTEQLANGPVLVSQLRARALAEQPSITRKALDNASASLGVVKGRPGAQMNTWSLPVPVGTSGPQKPRQRR